jgi:hypothetical protein
MSNYSEPRDLRWEDTNFKNICKFMIIKINLMIQVKEEFV